MMYASVDPPSTSFQALYTNPFCTTSLFSGDTILFFTYAQIRATLASFAPFRAVSTHAKPTKSKVSPLSSAILDWHRNCY